MKTRNRLLGRLKDTSGSLQRFSEHTDFGLELKNLWFGVIMGLGVWLVAAIFGLGWIALSGAGTHLFSVYVYAVGILGVVLGGLLAGSRSGGKGWLHGLWVGVLLALCGIIANLELIPQSYSWLGMIRQLILWALWGLLGGYLGQLLKPAKRGKTMGRRG